MHYIASKGEGEGSTGGGKVSRGGGGRILFRKKKTGVR